MREPAIFLALFLLMPTAVSGRASEFHPQTPWKNPLAVQPAGATCKRTGSCEEAVKLWCSGYGRADADHDGIPCENVCSTRAEVEEIEARIGCSL